VFGFEPGLLNLAFDPASPNDAYLWYTSCRPTPGDDSARCFEQAERRSGVDQALYIVLSRMVRGDDGVFDPDSEQVLLAITSEPNHFGHGPLFGPDGMLYVGIGDGREVGASGPRDSSRLQGKILRLDVHGEDGKRLVDPPYYRVPNNNPYVGKPGARAEIFASGLRNPWRMAIDNQDPVTLLLGDVGDATMEEINRVKAGSDLGWPAMEGNECRNPDRLDAMTVKRPCVPPSGVTAPIHAYHHSQGISVTGGVVYRGKGIPELSGAYLFTDFLRGALTRIDPGQAPRRILDLDIMVTNFATDLEGEVYLTDFVTGGIFRLVAAETGAPPPVSLRKTGCVDMAHPTRPAPGGIPFDIGVPAFTEPGVSASRTLFLPADQKVERTAEGLELPRGSVIVQHHSRESQPIETRLLSLHEDGGWTGWAYQWHDGEATRVDTAIDVDIDPIRWHHPAPGECMDCHREGTLGMTPAQLGSGTLQTLECLGRFDGDTETAPLPSDSAPVEERLAAYLSVNCGHCHVPGFPGGRARGYFILANNGFRSACGVGPQMAVYDDPDSRILVPGNPDHSLLLRRLMESELPYRMPPYRHGVDPVGTGLVRAWLADAPPCGGR